MTSNGSSRKPRPSATSQSCSAARWTLARASSAPAAWRRERCPNSRTFSPPSRHTSRSRWDRFRSGNCIGRSGISRTCTEFRCQLPPCASSPSGAVATSAGFTDSSPSSPRLSSGRRAKHARRNEKTPEAGLPHTRTLTGFEVGGASPIHVSSSLVRVLMRGSRPSRAWFPEMLYARLCLRSREARTALSRARRTRHRRPTIASLR